MSKPTNVQRKKRDTGTVIIEAPGVSSSLAEIRITIIDLARQTGFTEDDVAKIEMAVDEACANVVEHAYAAEKEWRWQQGDPVMRLEVRTRPGQLIIEITDNGRSFDFANYRPPDLDQNIQDMKSGGFGVAIMRRIMDEVQYASDPQRGNTLRLVKYLKKS